MAKAKATQRKQKQEAAAAAAARVKAHVHSVKASLRATARTKNGPGPGPASLPRNNDTKLASLLALDEVEGGDKGDAKGKRKARESVEQHTAPPNGRKTVFRHVLTSPLAVTWPTASETLLTPILHILLEVLASPLLDMHVRRPGGSAELNVDSGKGRRMRARDAQQKERRRRATSKDTSSSSSSSPPPSASKCILTGLNELTRTLEMHIEAVRRGEPPGSSAAPPRLLFVCAHDVDPPALLAHLPLLACAYNAVCAPDALHLVPLPHGAEALLARALGLRRCALLGLTSDAPPVLLARLLGALQGVLDPPRAPWLEVAAHASRAEVGGAPTHHAAYVPPVVRHLRTTAPLDASSAHAQRKGALKAARERARSALAQRALRLAKAAPPDKRLRALRLEGKHRKAQRWRKREEVMRAQDAAPQ